MPSAISGITAFPFAFTAVSAAAAANSRIREFQTGAIFPEYREYEPARRCETRARHWPPTNSPPAGNLKIPLALCLAVNLKAANCMIQVERHFNPVHFSYFLAMIHIGIVAKIFQGDTVALFKGVRDISFPGLIAICKAIDGSHNILTSCFLLYE
jgi:hypothetical protein